VCATHIYITATIGSGGSGSSTYCSSSGCGSSRPSDNTWITTVALSLADSASSVVVRLRRMLESNVHSRQVEFIIQYYTRYNIILLKKLLVGLRSLTIMKQYL